MISQLCLVTIISLLLMVSSQSPDAEVRILAYDILPPDQYHRYNDAHYAFESCICNRPSRDPKLSRFCTCSDLKGRTIRDGMLNDTERCMKDNQAAGCLVAALPYFDKESPIYYIRVSVNGFVLSQPGWQELTQGDNKTTTVSIPSTTGSHISLTFAISEHLQRWNNRGSDAKNGEVRGPIAKEKKGRPWFLMTSTASPFWTRMRTTAELISTTTTIPPLERNEWQENDVEETTSVSSNTDYLRFIDISNMYELRNVLYMESIRDQIPAYQLDIQDYKNELIAHHNEIRALHGVPSLEYDPYLEAEAQRWASMLGSRGSCIAHDPNRRHGECLFYFGGLTLPNAQTLAALTVQSFYLEKNSYDYNNYRPVFFYRTGHFTQLVWKSSRRIGVGVHIGLASGGGAPCRPYSPTYQLYVVVKYDPPGNVQSSYAYRNNVFPRIR